MKGLSEPWIDLNVGYHLLDDESHKGENMACDRTTSVNIVNPHLEASTIKWI